MSPEAHRVPPALIERAREFAASGAEPVAPRTAATVVLLREAPLEAYLVRRVRAMTFGGNYAFPGGAVDLSDAEVRLDWVGPEPAEWGRRLGVPEATAQAIVCAAGREVFEEVGVLLAGPDAGSVVGDVSGPKWTEARTALERREWGFADFLRREGLALRADLLAPWNRWITPEFEPRRFDTYFFVAALPAGQRAGTSGEADHVVWITPAEAVSRADTGDLGMLPPTRTTLAELADCRDLAGVLAAAAGRDAANPVLPRVETGSDGSVRLVTD